MSRAGADTVIARALRPRGPVTLDLRRRRVPDTIVLEVGGELDLLTVGRLTSALDRELRHGTSDVIVDLSRTEFIDSAGLHILLNANRRLTRQGRSLAVVCPPGPVWRVFELAKLLETLRVAPSLREYRRRRRGSPDQSGPRQT